MNWKRGGRNHPKRRVKPAIQKADSRQAEPEQGSAKAVAYGSSAATEENGSDALREASELAVLAADLDNVLRNIHFGILFLDNELRIRRFTPALSKIVNLVEQDIGRSVKHFALNFGSDFITDVNRVFETTEAVEREARNAQGSWLLVRILPYVTHAGELSGAVVTFVDITPMKNAYEMTRVANDQLAYANSELSRQRKELEAQLEDMFSIVAHDLKRPVLALNGLLTLLQEETDESVDASDRTLVEKALSECGRMKRMLEDLGHVSRVTRRKEVLQSVELQPWLDGLVDRFRAIAEERSIRLNCACDAGSAWLPQATVEEAFVNLMENAYKYGCTDPQPRIDVSCQLAQRELVLAIRDNGRGIAPENQQKVFEPFRRLDPAMADGTGIGLVAVRRMVGLHGGVVSLESDVGRGATFTVRVPVRSEDDDPDQSSRRKPRILLVEDDTLDAKMIERYLGGEYSVSVAKQLSDAEERLKQEEYDLVLLDLSLPDGHGFELVNKMRTVIGTAVPITVITGHGEGVAPSAMSATIAGYISKAQLKKEDLRAAVQGALAGSRPRTGARSL